MMRSGAAISVMLAAAVPALADQPRAVPATTICSLSGAICATRGRDGVAVWRKLPQGGRKPLWRAPTRAEAFRVADDGRSLVAIQLWANLVDAAAGPATLIFTFHAPDRPPVRVTLGQMIRDVPRLPRTASHRRWASTFGYDGRGHFQVNTVERRRLLFDPATGSLVAG